MVEVLTRTMQGDDAAELSLALYQHRLRAAVASMVGVDVLVFIGGVGEHAPMVREKAVSGLAFSASPSTRT
jgi:acetate kinase